MPNNFTKDARVRMLCTTTAPPCLAVSLRRTSGDKVRGAFPCPRDVGCVDVSYKLLLSCHSDCFKVGFTPLEQRVSKQAIGKQADGARKAYLMLRDYSIQVKMNQSFPLTKIKKDTGKYGLSEVLFWICL